MTTEEYRPSSVADAQDRIIALGAEIQNIEFNLQDRNKKHPDGSRMSNEEYWQWRHRAMGARNARQREMTRLKLWIRQERRREAAELGGPELLAALYRIGKSIPANELSAAELHALDTAQAILAGRAA